MIIDDLLLIIGFEEWIWFGKKVIFTAKAFRIGGSGLVLQDG